MVQSVPMATDYRCDDHEKAKEKITPHKQGKLDQGDEREPKHTSAEPLKPITTVE